MSIRVVQNGEAWAVYQDGELVRAFPTNGQAWRFADGLTGEPYNRKEAAHEWALRKSAGDEHINRRKRWAIRRAQEAK